MKVTKAPVVKYDIEVDQSEMDDLILALEIAYRHCKEAQRPTFFSHLQFALEKAR